jgi:hypothetical protein
VEAPHILLLFMLVFFAVGVARVEKRWWWPRSSRKRITIT